MRFKRDEIRSLVGLGIGMPMLMGLGWWLWGPVVLVPAIAGGLVLLLAVQLGSARRLRMDLAESLQQTQALLFISSHLKTDQPIPPLGGAALLPDSAATLIGLINERRPQLIVELGSGVSTVIAAAALRQLGTGRIISLDHDEHYASLTRSHLRHHRLTDWAEVRHAPIEVTHIDGQAWNWYSKSALGHEGAIDLLIVDGPPRKVQSLARYPAVRVLFDRLAPNCVIVVDDTNRGDEREIVRRWKSDLTGFDVVEIPHGEGTTVFRRAA